MIVEDERIVALHLTRQLEKLGYDVVAVAASGAKALKDIVEARADIVLMDIHIEGDIDGVETAARIPPELEIPVIYVTAYSEDSTLERARATKPYGYLVKPFSERELHATIQMALERRRSDSALRTSERQLAALTETLRGEVAERTRAEELAKQNEDRFRSIFAAVDDGIFIVGQADGKFIEINRAGAGMLGYEPGELIGLDFTTVSSGEPPYSENELSAWTRKAVGSGQPQRFDWQSRAKDGRLFWSELSVRTASINSQDVVIASARDMTERRTIEAELRQAQKMEVIGQLAGGMAHDFNNLLAIIQGNLEFLGEYLAGDSEGLEMTDDALKATERGARLTHQLLAYSRQQALTPKSVGVGELVSNTVRLLRRTLSEAIEIRVVLPANIWRTHIDAHQLENALLNLAVNARDAMPDGGRLTIEAANRFLDEYYTEENPEIAPGRYVLLSVTDTGRGIPREALVRVLEPFFTTKPVGKGSGLGLSMVYGFVRQSGGHIKIYSEVGIGTTVNLFLPKAAEDSLEADGVGLDSAQLPSAGAGETILVVEDEEMVRKLAVRVLASLGYRTVAAVDGYQALEMLDRSERVDLLMTDVVLPKGMNGPMLAREASERRPGLKVLFMSGYARNAMSSSGDLELGAMLLTKPFTKTELAQKLRSLLDEGDSG